MTLTEHVAMVTSGARGRMMLSERAPSPVHQRISCSECAMVLGHTLRRLYDSTSWSVDVVASSSTGLGWRSRCSSELLLSLRKPFRPVAGVHTAKTWSRSALRPPETSSCGGLSLFAVMPVALAHWRRVHERRCFSQVLLFESYCTCCAWSLFLLGLLEFVVDLHGLLSI